MKSDYWFFLALVLLAVSLIMHQAPLALLSLLFLLSGAVSRIWNKYCLHRVTFKRRLSSTRVFFGDEITYEYEITNMKPLPLPWLQVLDELPEQVTLLKGKTEPASEHRVYLNSMFPVNMYHRVIRRYPVKCPVRGCFSFGPAVLRSGDPFGLFRRSMEVPDVDTLMVYPRLVSLEELGIPSKQFFGDIRLRQHIFQDPVLTAGVRDYYPGDSLKRIHWKSTARLGKLQTKIFEPTTTVDLSLFLDVRTLKPPYWGSIHQLQELGIITAAAVARHALEAGFRVGLYVNQITRFSQGLVRVPHSQHPEQLERILEALAQIHQVENIEISKYVRQEAPHLPFGSSIVVITAQPADEMRATLLTMKRMGRSVAIIQVGGEAPESGGYVPVYHVTDEKAWEVVEKIGLKQA